MRKWLDKQTSHLAAARAVAVAGRRRILRPGSAFADHNGSFPVLVWGQLRGGLSVALNCPLPCRASCLWASPV